MRMTDGSAWFRKRFSFAGLTFIFLLSSQAAAADDNADCNASDELLKIDPGRAVAACDRLAEKGDIVAQYNLGLMYFGGQGVPQDYSQALKWFHKAASQGDAPAQYSLGLMFQDGQGVEQDGVEAAMWYRKSAEQGYVYAQNALGFMYGTGEGVPTNLVEAYLWLSLAASAGDDDASAYRDVMEKGMTPGQLTKARRLVDEWKPKKPPAGQPGY